MRRIRSWAWAVSAVLAAVTALAAQQVLPARRIVLPVREGQRVRLAGGTNPLVFASADQGQAADDLALSRAILVLRRSPEQGEALRSLVAAQQQPESAEFHRWLTPAEFGQRFGANPGDVAAISRWLASHGLHVDAISPGGSALELSGSAGELAAAFDTRIHRYQLRGRSYLANASDPSVPLALAPVVAGFLSLNNFPRSIAPQPLLNQPQDGSVHLLAPADFATIYNVAPLYAQGLNGSGAAIAVVARSDFPPGGVAAFRSAYLPNAPQSVPFVIHNGADPGVAGVAAELNEAELDAEWAGAVAPDASVDFVVSASTDTTDGSDLSAQYIVDHALAPVMSSSFGACEATLGGPGSSGNLFYQNLYEQAAAEGITVVVSSGDSGAAGCDAFLGTATGGLAVNGLASTPFDVAVGGTEFDDSGGDYWASSNAPTDQSSVLGYIPEQAWNESCAGGSCGAVDLAAGGGGTSVIYAKPDWQSAPGVPADGARDLPDLAFAASLKVAYAMCLGSDDCPGGNEGSGLPPVYSSGSGTSAAAQAFAGVVALLVQKAGGALGLINPELYQLAAQAPAAGCDASASPADNCIFRDITAGTNAVPCQAGSPDCSAGLTSLPNGTPAYSAGPGYDLATGLGSLNVANLVNAWPTLVDQPTEISLAAAPASLTHGQVLTATVTVAAAAGTPGGTVEVLDGSGPGSAVLGTAALQAGQASLQLNDLPGGTDTISAHFAGSPAYAPSTSAAVQVVVAPEPSQVTLTVAQADANGNWNPATSTYYGAPLDLDASVAGVSGVAANGGEVSFADGGTPLASGVVPINGDGSAALQLPNLAVGSHLFAASYTGNSSLLAAAAPTVALQVQPADTATTLTATSDTQPDGTQRIGIFATVSSTMIANPETTFAGTVTFTDAAGQTLGSTSVAGDGAGGLVRAGARVIATIPAGANAVTAHYSGDGNFLGSDSAPLALDGGAFHFTVSPATATASAGGAAVFTVTAVLDSPLADSTVTLSCSPAGAPGITCATSLPAVTLTPGAPAAGFTVTAGASQGAAAPAAPPPEQRWGGLLLLPGLGLLLLAWRRGRRRAWALGGLLLLASACGGPAEQSSVPPPGVTPPGQYSIFLQGQAGVDHAQSSLSLQVP